MGIRATLSSIGPTRVTIGPDAFRTVTMRRDPQLVALTSPFNATGLFDLDAQPELLVPFEGLGVDGQWVFEMPLAANPFDYDAIADVLVTIDYTALHSPDYRDQLLRTMDRRFGADRAFSFQHEFEDAWYDLNNPDLVDAPDAPMTVSFTTRRNDFPPHIHGLIVGQVLLQFVQKVQTAQVVNVEALFFTTVAGQTVPIAIAARAAASDATGLISTRRGAWGGLIGGAIDSDLTWTLTLPNAVKARFTNEEITDIFFVVSYTGQS
jgi:Tc toxin complex TcA C-terminal TcB-binding domain